MDEVTIITHNGGFHADDVFAVATIILSLSQGANFKVVRTRDEKVISEGSYVVDVGQIYDPSKRRFDHHQTEGAGVRANGVPYASFGLVWKEYGLAISGSESIHNSIEQKLVLPIDASDNGVSIFSSTLTNVRPYTISDYLYSFWIDEHTEQRELDHIFHRVVSMAKDLLIREIQKASNVLNDELKVLKVYEDTSDKRLIVLDSYLAWGRVLLEKPEPLVVVYPSVDGLQWSAKTVPAANYSFERRAYFPKSWSGKVHGELQKLADVEDALFCHKNLFLATAKSKEGAVKLAQHLM